MRITVLLENTAASSDMEVEHGLSLFIETGTKTILFDMGQTDLFARNAGKLGCDLSRVDAAVLSHGHYDHGGGLERFLEINSHAPVYLSPYAFEPHYNGSDKYIGLDTAILKIVVRYYVDVTGDTYTTLIILYRIVYVVVLYDIAPRIQLILPTV